MDTFLLENVFTFRQLKAFVEDLILHVDNFHLASRPFADPFCTFGHRSVPNTGRFICSALRKLRQGLHLGQKRICVHVLPIGKLIMNEHSSRIFQSLKIWDKRSHFNAMLGKHSMCCRDSESNIYSSTFLRSITTGENRSGVISQLFNCKDLLQ